MTKLLSPMESRSEKDILRLRTDNCSTPDFWILADGDSVTLCEQRVGETKTAQITIPRADFNRLVRWYTKPQKVRE